MKIGSSSLRMFCILCVFLGIGIAAPGLAEIYSWTDSAGQEHFTSDLSQVPADKRVAAKAGAEANENKTLRNYNQTTLRPRPEVDPEDAFNLPDSPSVQRNTAPKQNWKNKAQYLRRKVKDAEAALERAREYESDMRSMSGYRQAKAEYRRQKAERRLEAAEKELDDYLEYARRNGAEWGDLR